MTKAPVTLEKYSVYSDLVVADLMGGERLPIVDSKSMTQPFTALGEMLVVDAQGNLHVQNEGQDIEYIRRLTVVKEDPNKPKQPTDTGDTAGGLSPAGTGGRTNRRQGCF